MAPEHPESPTAFRLGPFDLHQQVGHGGMGLVFSGVHRATGSPAAIKLLRSELANQEQQVRLFRREVRAVAALDHPSIVQIYDYGQVTKAEAQAQPQVLTAGGLFLAMEYISGGSLSQQDTQATWRGLRAVILDVLAGLAHAHARGVIHRDIKPGNVLLTHLPGGRVRAKLTDFGIALVQTTPGEAMDEDDVVGWSPGYTAPERFLGDPDDIGPWSDLYSLGCLCWALCTGRPPFLGTTLQETLQLQMADSLPAFEPRLEMPAFLGNWLAMLLRRSPNSRLQRAAQAMAALQSLESGKRWDPRRLIFTKVWDEDPPTDQPFHSAAISLYGLRQPPLVNRDTEREALWSALEQAVETQEPHLVVLRGPPGMGKSRLARWLSQRAVETGAAEVSWAAHDASQGPFHGVRPLLRDVLRVSSAKGEKIGSRIFQRMASLGLEGEHLRDAYWELVEPARLGQERVRFSSSAEQRALIISLLRSLARGYPQLLWLDDLHWGIGSMALVEDLLSSTDPVGPILVVATVRDEEVGPGSVGSSLLERLLSHPTASEVRVGPLEDAELRSLVRDLLKLRGPLVDEVTERCGGNPLFASQLVGDWVQRGLLLPGDDGFALAPGADPSLPPDLQAVWRTRIESMLQGRPPVERIGLELAAALGQSVDRLEWALCCAAAGFTIPEGLEPRLADLGLIREDEAGFRFAHGLARESIVLACKNRAKWAQRNQACAQALKDQVRPGEGARMARIFREAGMLGDAVDATLQAFIWNLEQGNHKTAERLYEDHGALLDRLDAASDDRRRLEARVQALRLIGRSGRYDELMEESQTIAAHAKAKGWPDLRAQALMAFAPAIQARKGVKASLPLVEEALSLFEEAGNRQGIVEAKLLLGRAIRNAGDQDQAARMQGEALAIAEELGEPPTLTRALTVYGDTLGFVGQVREAKFVLERALELVLKHGLLRQEIRVRLILCGILIRPLRLDEAAVHSFRARQLAVQLGHLADESDACVLQGEVARKRGHLSTAEEAYSRSLLLSEALGSGWIAAPRTNLGLVLLERGLFRRARDVITQARQEFDEAGRTALSELITNMLLPCHAAIQDWESFDRDWDHVKDFQPGKSPVDHDSARLLAQAAALAEEYGRSHRAQACGLLAAQQYRALQQPEEADSLELRYGPEDDDPTFLPDEVQTEVFKVPREN